MAVGYRTSFVLKIWILLNAAIIASAFGTMLGRVIDTNSPLGLLRIFPMAGLVAFGAVLFLNYRGARLISTAVLA
jgi:hypothetical protein